MCSVTKYLQIVFSRWNSYTTHHFNFQELTQLVLSTLHTHKLMYSIYALFYPLVNVTAGNNSPPDAGKPAVSVRDDLKQYKNIATRNIIIKWSIWCYYKEWEKHTFSLFASFLILNKSGYGFPPPEYAPVRLCLIYQIRIRPDIGVIFTYHVPKYFWTTLIAPYWPDKRRG